MWIVKNRKCQNEKKYKTDECCDDRSKGCEYQWVFKCKANENFGVIEWIWW